MSQKTQWVTVEVYEKEHQVGNNVVTSRFALQQKYAGHSRQNLVPTDEHREVKVSELV